jgi:hypothetical protein
MMRLFPDQIRIKRAMRVDKIDACVESVYYTMR